ncbi:hypothetical protein JCM10207_000573 [Rhodosporidiobolus poonsookiae]
MSGFPGARYHSGYKHTVVQGGQGYGPPSGPPPQQGFGPSPGPPPGQYGGGNQWGPPPGPPPGQFGGGGYGGGGGGGFSEPSYGGQQGGYGGPPQGGYGGGGGGYDSRSSGGGYNAGYQSPPGQGYDQQMPHPHHNQQQYNAPPQYGGQGQYPQQYSAPPGPPPMHYGQPQQHYQGPSQYQGGQFEMHYAPPSNMSGYYSDLSGKRKALCIGINYTGTSSQLNGCHNDAKNISKFLVERYNYREEDIVMLMDTPGASGMSVPTKANILRAMQWLVRDAKPNDALFFHYSGHGGQTADKDGDEADGYDETIYPLDHKQAGVIVDDEMHAIMVGPLPQGCRLTAIFDCCHSGSALDLPYIYSTKGKLKEPNMLADAGSGALGAATSYLRGDLGGVFKSLTGVGKRIMNGDKATEYAKATRSSNADVISWSGCKDTQTSADASIGGQSTGAMSWESLAFCSACRLELTLSVFSPPPFVSQAFITALTKYPQQSYLQLLNTIRDELEGKYQQLPQISCSHELDMNLMAVF